ncbi:MAG: hypothetical protein R3D34_14260 [Nitratireductor sp.]
MSGILSLANWTSIDDIEFIFPIYQRSCPSLMRGWIRHPDTAVAVSDVQAFVIPVAAYKGGAHTLSRLAAGVLGRVLT